MRAMKALPLAMLLAVTLLGSLCETGLAKKQTGPAFPALGNIRSFEIHDIEMRNFSATRENIPHETVEYARTAMQHETRLRYESPAQGILRFSCDNGSCTKIRAEVTQGEAGPVVWQTVQPFKSCPFRFLPDSRKFSNRVIDQLAQDYQEAMKASPTKIQIREE